MKAALIVALALTALTGCARAPTFEEGLFDRDARVSRYRVKYSNPYDLVYIRSKGEATNVVVLTFIRSGVGTGNSWMLGDILKDRSGREASLLVTGADNALTAETLLDALGRLGGKRLDGAELVYIGSPAYEAKLRAAVNATGATFIFVQFP